MRFALIASTSVMLLVGCSTDNAAIEDTVGDTAAQDQSASTIAGTSGTASATIRDSTGRELGRVTIRDTVGGMMITGNLQGLPPGPHAIHLHMTGLCEPPFESAGGHWNPTNRQHGTENPQGPHLGDMPNITVSPDSSVSISVMTPGGSVRGGTPLLDEDGAAVVIHAGPDDYKTDPSGDSGGRIACGTVS
jgi:Cu-Zn family superoxide dismutase